MKTKALFGIAALAAFGLTACSNASGTPSAAGASANGDKEMLYSGILPAADAQGNVVTLKLDFDDDHNYTDGDFIMVENTVAADSISAAGITAASTSYSEGDFRKATKQVDGKTLEYLVLTPDAKDLLGAATATPSYFLINENQTLTLVNADIELPANPELYTLTAK
ncbi:MAG: hypothetical protein K2O24_00415 [Muribaculaceae bacterium]|nr:hypothetical protein [Muribaculaceae bacterium]